MRVYFDTFGCRLNKAESLQMEAECLAKGWQLARSHSDANVLVVRACSVTSRAEHDCDNLIAHLKSKYPNKRLIVCGCSKNRCDTVTNKAVANASLECLSPQFPSANSPIPTRTARAYLKIQDGCSGQCSFCIVPQFRGKSVSIGFSVALERAKRFVDAGYHELVITGCNLALYASEGKRLPDLVSQLAQLDPNCRIRLGSIEPGNCALEVIDAMYANANVCRFLHLAAQSGSDRVLFAMQRPYSAEAIAEAVAKAIAKMPNLGLGCDLMTGFPGETDADFLKTRDLLYRLPFNNAHIFPFSSRPDTTAAALPDQIPHALRIERAHELHQLATAKRTAFARSFIGKEVSLIVESAKTVKGWSGEYLTCESLGSAERKNLVTMTVTRTRGDTLIGTLS